MKGDGQIAEPLIYEYRGALYPSYLKTGNACQHIAATARHFCRGSGLDIGAGKWPLQGALAVDAAQGDDVLSLPVMEGGWDYVFSSHCLEHLPDYVAALEHWRERLRPGGVLFLYLPSPQMTYWLPQHCKRHRSVFHPADTAQLLRDLGFVDVIFSERDLAWSFAVCGFKPT